MLYRLATDSPATAVLASLGLSRPQPTGILAEVLIKRQRESRLRRLVDDHVGMVARILRNAGTPEAEIEDNVQRVFIALSNRLDEVTVGAERSFLVQTALHMAAHARRTMARRHEILTDSPPDRADSVADPEERVQQRQARILLDRILDEMNPDLRAVFTLYEFEEMTTAEIASILDIPTGTVASRLRRARVDFRQRVATFEDLSQREVG